MRLILSAVIAAFAIFQVSAPAPTFTPAWQAMLLGDGGNAQGVHAFASGTILSHVDTYGAYLYQPSGTCTIGARTLPTPCWQELISTNSIDSSLWLSIQSGQNLGAVDIVECQGNTNVFYMIWAGNVYVSTNRGGTWVKTPQTFSVAANNGPIYSIWIGCDPADTTGNTVYITNPSNGVFKSTNGTSGASSTWAHNATIASSAGGSVLFDPTSSVVGGVTQHFWISADATGVYETYNGGSSFTLTTSTPAVTRVLSVDKFGQLWSGGGYGSTNGTISRYIPSGTAGTGTWSTSTPGGTLSFLAIVFDPTCSTACATSANNHVMVIDSEGQIIASLNNGGAWTFTGNTTVSAAAPQAGWLGTANYGNNTSPALNVNGGTIDSTGKLWLPGGTSIWTTQEPIIGCPSSCAISTSGPPWAANSIGIEQLVVNQILSPPGGAPVSAVWDRGVLLSPNPDAFATVQFPQGSNGTPINHSFGVDYALQTLPVVGGTYGSFLTAAIENQGSFSASSTDGGSTWTQWAAFPTGHGAGATIAASTTTNWCGVPGNGSTPSAQIWCTLNGATSWIQATTPGSPQFIGVNQLSNAVHMITADKTTAGAFYALSGSDLYISSNGNTGSPSFAKTSNPFSAEIANGNQKIQAVPGQAGNIFVSLGSGGTHLWKSSSSGVSWATACSSFTQIENFGFGAPVPGGSGYPTIYGIAIVGSAFQAFYSKDGGTTCQAISAPTNQQTWPINSIDYPTWVNGDLNVYGRIYYGFIGSGNGYIDMADACPWVNFDQVSVKANSSLTGTVTLTALHSGLVPVTGVNFSVDGVQIGSTQTGAGPYSVSWVTGGVATGSHTLKVQAIGNGCTSTSNSFSIPVATH